MKCIIVLIMVSLFFIGQASAGQYSVNGTTYDTTWDGRVIPSNQIVYGSNDDVILVQPLIPATAFTVGNDTIYINNNFTSFKRDKFRVSPIMTFPKTLLASEMVSVNATVGYLVFPYSLSRVKDFISDNEIRMGNWTFRAGQEHIDIYDDNQTTLNGTQNILNKSAYTFRIVSDEIRLYFLKSEVNKLQGNITFEMNSWTINGSTTPAWQNSSYSNFALDRNTGNLILPDNVTNGLVLYHKMSGSSGIISYDMNTTSNNNGTLMNMKTGLDNGTSGRNSSGKYGNAISFDGADDSVSIGTLGDNDVGNGTSNFSITAWVRSPDTTSLHVIIGKVDFGVNEWGLFQNGGKWQFQIRDNTAALYVASGTYNANEWYFLTAVRNSTGLVLYVNGTSVFYTAGTRSPNTTAKIFYIGRRNADAAYNFMGLIDEVRIYNRALTNDEINQTMNNTMVGSNNSTHWYDFGAGRQGAYLMFNFTNTSTTFVDAYASTDNFTTSNVLVVSNITNATWVTIPANAKNQTQYIRAVLKGNTTSTPELIEVSIEDEAVSTGETLPNIPPTPINLSNTTGNFWVNHTWEAGSGNVTDSYNVSHNGTWMNGSSVPYYNASLNPSGWSNITIWAWNSSGIGTLSLTNISNNSQAPDASPTDYPPNISAWYNTINGYNQTTMSINAGNSATFNVTVNQTIINVSWNVSETEEQNMSSLQFTRAFNTIGDFNVTARAFNENGSSNIIYTVVTVTTTGGGGTDWDYAYGWVKWNNGTPVNSATVSTIEGNEYTDANGYYVFGYVFEHGVTYDFNISKSGIWNNKSVLFTSDDYEIINGTLQAIVPPTISSWGNSNTSNNTLTFSVLKNTNVTFYATADQPLTGCTWTGATQINCTGTSTYAYKNFSSTGVKNVNITGSSINGSTQTITWTITVLAAEGISFSGYVQNELGVPLQNSRVDFNGNYEFTNSVGYYEFTNISEGTYSVLARAISYQNSSTTIQLISDTILNFTLYEKSWATSDDTNSSGAMGFVGGVIGGAMVISVLRRKKSQ